MIEGGDLGDYYSLSKIIGENDTKLEYELFSQNAFIDSLIFIDDVLVTKRIQKLIFKTMVGTTPTVETQSTFNSIFTTNNYVSAKSFYQIVRYENEKVGAVIRWEPVSESYFSGIIGANRSDDDSWVFNGQLDLHFENSWNTLNRIDVNGSILQQYSPDEEYCTAYLIDDGTWMGCEKQKEYTGDLKTKTLVKANLAFPETAENGRRRILKVQVHRLAPPHAAGKEFAAAGPVPLDRSADHDGRHMDCGRCRRNQ